MSDLNRYIPPKHRINSLLEELKQADDREAQAVNGMGDPITSAACKQPEREVEPEPIIVCQAKSWPEIAKRAFKSMTYGEFVEIIEWLAKSSSLQFENGHDLANVIWRWANENQDHD